MKVFILIYNLYLYKNIKYIYNVDWRDKKPFQHLKIVKRQPRLVCLEQSEGEPSPASALCSLHLSPLTRWGTTAPAGRHPTVRTARGNSRTSRSLEKRNQWRPAWPGSSPSLISPPRSGPASSPFFPSEKRLNNI